MPSFTASSIRLSARSAGFAIALSALFVSAPISAQQALALNSSSTPQASAAGKSDSAAKPKEVVQTAKEPSSLVFRAGGVSFSLPAPNSELIEIGPDYRPLLETFVPATNRLLAAYTSAADLEKIKAHDISVAPTYAMVQSLRAAESEDVSPEIFKQVVDSAKSQMDQSLDKATADQIAALNQRLKSLDKNAPAVSLEKPIQLGTFFNTKSSYGFGLVMPFKSSEKAVNMASGAAFIRVKGRLLFAFIYTPYNGDASVQWISKTLENWTNELIKANQ